MNGTKRVIRSEQKLQIDKRRCGTARRVRERLIDFSLPLMRRAAGIPIILPSQFAHMLGQGDKTLFWQFLFKLQNSYKFFQ